MPNKKKTSLKSCEPLDIYLLQDDYRGNLPTYVDTSEPLIDDYSMPIGKNAQV
jgi:hypothetical protein